MVGCFLEVYEKWLTTLHEIEIDLEETVFKVSYKINKFHAAGVINYTLLNVNKSYLHNNWIGFCHKT